MCNNCVAGGCLAGERGVRYAFIKAVDELFISPKAPKSDSFESASAGAGLPTNSISAADVSSHTKDGGKGERDRLSRLSATAGKLTLLVAVLASV